MKQYNRRGIPPAIMRKGGVHQRAGSSHRFRARMELDESVTEWFVESEPEETDRGRKNQKGSDELPSSFLQTPYLHNFSGRFNPTILRGI